MNISLFNLVKASKAYRHQRPMQPGLAKPYSNNTNIVRSEIAKPEFSIASANGIDPVYAQCLDQAGISVLRSLAKLQPDIVQAVHDSRVSLTKAQDFVAQAHNLLQLNSS